MPQQEVRPEPEAAPGLSSRPLVVSAILAFLYVLLCTVYITISTNFAASLSLTVAQLEKIELWKGLVFVAVTGVAYFGAAYVLLRRLSTQEARILRQENALVAAEGRSMAGIFASSIAHDMGNLLTSVRLNMHFLNPVLENSGKETAVAQMKQGIGDLSDLITRLATIGRGPNPFGVRSVDLAGVVRSVVAFGGSHASIRRCRLSTVVSGPVIVEADETLIVRMLMNLMINAAEAAGKGGRIEIRLRGSATDAHLEVHDSGPGVPEAMRRTIFDPFYTSKPNGTGLGLLSVKVCAEEHQGTVTVTDSDLGGACFAVSLPVRAAADAALAVQAGTR
jgi:signal transduction histidine kinase